MMLADAPADRDEWLAWRRDGITATDIAKASSGRYGGMWGVVRDKLGMADEEPPNAAMERGSRWENAITTAAEHLLGLAVVGEQMLATHQDHTTHRATIDGLLVPIGSAATIDDVVGLIEIKTHGRHVRPAWDYWGPQVQWQMHCTGLALAVVVSVEIDDSDDSAVGLRLTRIERDEFVIDHLVDLANEIEAWVSMGDLPDPPASALETIRAASVEAWTPDAETVDLSHLADDLQRFAAIKDAVKAVEDERDALQAKLINAMGAATSGVCGDLRVSLSKPRSVLTKAAELELLAERPDLGMMTLDRAKAKAEAKALYESLCEPVGARTLTVRTPK